PRGPAPRGGCGRSPRRGRSGTARRFPGVRRGPGLGWPTVIPAPDIPGHTIIGVLGTGGFASRSRMSRGAAWAAGRAAPVPSRGPGARLPSAAALRDALAALLDGPACPPGPPAAAGASAEPPAGDPVRGGSDGTTRGSPPYASRLVSRADPPVPLSRHPAGSRWRGQPPWSAAASPWSSPPP